jgi:hypothetical protein
MSTEAELRALLLALDAPELDEPLDAAAAAEPVDDEDGPPQATLDGDDPAPSARPDARHLLPPRPAPAAATSRAAAGPDSPDLKAAAEVFGDHSSARPGRWSGEAPEADARPSRRRQAEGHHRLGQVLEALVGALVAAGELDLRPGAAPEGVAARLTAALRATGGFTQFGRSAAAVLLADPEVEELYLDDQQLTRRLTDLG